MKTAILFAMLIAVAMAYRPFGYGGSYSDYGGYRGFGRYRGYGGSPYHRGGGYRGFGYGNNWRRPYRRGGRW